MFGRKSDASSESPPAQKTGFFARLRAQLNRGNSWLTRDIADLLPGRAIDAGILEELETRLLTADVGVEATESILEQLRGRVARKELKDFDALMSALKSAVLGILRPVERPLTLERAAASSGGPFVVLVVGVNGSGKTTTIGKLARRFKDNGLSVMLAAGDTFRAAAIEQLQVWGRRNDVPVIAQHSGADPAAVIFDAMQAAKARGIDVLLADTAGRLQNQTHLMDELKKVKRIIQRLDASAPHEVMLVLDAGLGQNALAQAAQFNDAVGVTGITLTKLDGSAKGGTVIAIAQKFGIPIRFIGIGEQAEDFAPFEAGMFVEALLDADTRG